MWHAYVEPQVCLFLFFCLSEPCQKYMYIVNTCYFRTHIQNTHVVSYDTYLYTSCIFTDNSFAVGQRSLYCFHKNLKTNINKGTSSRRGKYSLWYLNLIISLFGGSGHYHKWDPTLDPICPIYTFRQWNIYKYILDVLFTCTYTWTLTYTT